MNNLIMGEENGRWERGTAGGRGGKRKKEMEEGERETRGVGKR